MKTKHLLTLLVLSLFILSSCQNNYLSNSTLDDSSITTSPSTTLDDNDSDFELETEWGEDAVFVNFPPQVTVIGMPSEQYSIAKRWTTIVNKKQKKKGKTVHFPSF